MPEWDLTNPAQFVVVAGLLPLLYCICGLWVRFLAENEALPKPASPDAAPLIAGIWSLGVLGLVCWYLKLPFHGCSLLLLLPGTWILATSEAARRSVLRLLPEIYRYYLLLLVVVACYPLPGLFFWSGDWVDSTRQASLLMDGDALAGHPIFLMAARSPISGFGGGWAYVLMDRVHGVQAHFALAAAGMVLVLFRECECFFQKRFTLSWRLYLALSAPVVLHALAMWSKPLTTACLLLALGQALKVRTRFLLGNPGAKPLHAMGFWLAAAFSTHQSTILYAPLVVLLALWPLVIKRAWRGLLASAGMLLLYGALLGAMPDWSSLAWLGTEAKAALNPTLHFRSGASLPVQTLINLSDTVTGVPAAAVQRLAESESSLELWLAAGYTWALFAGTMLFSFLPFAPCLTQRTLSNFANPEWKSRFWLITLAVLWVVLVHAMLSPYGTDVGLVQNGLLPLQLLGMACAANLCATHASPLAQRLVQGALLLTGVVGILVISVMVSTLAFPLTPGSPDFEVLSRRLPDMRFVNAFGLSTVAGSFFPYMVIIPALGAVWLFARQAQSERPAPKP